MTFQYLEKSDAGIVREKKKVVIEKQLDLMVEKHGAVTSDLLVSEAEKPAHPLHKYFEWDNSAAGHKYRIAQATQMIMATKYICVLKRAENEPVHATAITQNRVIRKLLPAFDGNHGFRKREDVMADKQARKARVERKKMVLRSWCNEVIDFEEFDEIRAIIEGWLVGKQ